MSKKLSQDVIIEKIDNCNEKIDELKHRYDDFISSHEAQDEKRDVRLLNLEIQKKVDIYWDKAKSVVLGALLTLIGAETTYIFYVILR